MDDVTVLLVLTPESKLPDENSPLQINITHKKTERGWVKYSPTSKIKLKKIVSLGTCAVDGDCFSIHYYMGGVGEIITFCKGHLNNGKYKNR